MVSNMEPCNDECAAGRKRQDQSEIAFRWWDKKRTTRDEFLRIQQERDDFLEEFMTLKTEMDALKARNDSLVRLHASIEAEQNVLRAANETLERVKQHVEENDAFKDLMNALTQPLQNFGGFRKITDKTS